MVGYFPTISALAQGQRKWRLRASVALGTTDSRRLKEQSGSGGPGEYQWVKRGVSPLWTGPFVAGAGGDTPGR